MKNQKELIISADAVELSHLPAGTPLTVSVGENTLVVTPGRMTAIQAVNTIGALTAFTTDLIASHTQDGQLEPDCARAALDWWGFRRVQFVLSNTLRHTSAQGFEPDSL